jgi:nucleotide-binding universal stress UspA family protein
MWERILVPLDGSNLAELALPYAEELAAALGSEVVLLYVSEPAESHYRRMHQLYIEEMGGQMRKKIKKVSPVVLTGKPAEEIVGYAEKNDIGLIIITSHGRSGILSWATGSVANKVLQATTVPLLLIRCTKTQPKELPKCRLDRILLPLDGSAAGEAAVAYVQELMVRLGSEVILFGVVPAGQHIRSVGGLDYILYPEAQLAVFKREAGEYLDRIYQRLKDGKVRVELKVGDKSGDIAREILDFAEKNDVGLIAMSSHGHSGIERWVFGSIANKVVQASKVPVLMVKAVGAKT